MLNNKSKRISIVTWLGKGNFGTSLQSYALHEKLKQMGYNVFFLNQFDYPFTWKSYMRSIVNILGYRKWHKFSYYKGLKGKKLYNFNKNKYNQHTIYFPFQYRLLIKDTNIFISGSDQIWNTYNEYIPFMFLDFAGKCRRIAYASSIGTSNIPQNFIEIIKKHLSLFHSIGVREQTAAKVLFAITGRTDIIQVVDPTFLLKANDWYSLCKEAKLEIQIPEEYICCYLIGKNQEYVLQIEDVKTKTGIAKVVIIPSEENPDFKLSDAIVYSDAGPVEFVHLLRKSSFVCTDSFHATALSLNMSKPFVEFLRFKDADKNSQNSRLYNLLDHYNLRNRLYVKENTDWSKSLDYNLIQNIIEKDRELSLDYLITAIES